MTTKEAFLHRVRSAVVEGNRAGAAPGPPERGAVGYQGAGSEPVERFCQELKAAGGFPHSASDPEAAWQAVRQLIEAKAARNILLGQGGLIEALNMAERLRRHGRTVSSGEMAGAGARSTVFAADVGVSNVEYLVAETGSVVVSSGPDEPRSLSLLPPIHIAIAAKSQLLPDLFDLFDLFSPVTGPGKNLPSCLTLITGPSKTGDIELKLVTGVHGPGEVHVVLCTW